MKRKKTKKTSATKKIIIALTVLSISIALILFAIKQNNDIRSKAQATAINPATTDFPSKLFAPYIDVSMNPPYDFSGAYNATGQKYYILSFIISNGNCSPAWGGTTPTPINTNFLYDQINFLRGVGGDVIISYGGVSSAELGESCTTPETLQAAYQQVIDTYKIRWMDMNIERPEAVANTAASDRRNKALAALQKANPGLKVSYTIPVSTSGLTQDGLNLLSNAKTNGVNVAVVNPMTMNFGAANAPDPIGKMGQYSVQAITNAQTQVQNLGITTSYGITPMIGQNDTAGEIFLLTDVSTILNGAANPSISLLSMWSSSRDNGGCPNQKTASPSCSGITQSTYDFTKAFQGFTTPNPSTIITVIPTYNCIGGINCTPSIISTPSANPSLPINPNISINPSTINPNPSINTPPINPPGNGNIDAIRLFILFFILLFQILIGA